jgi:HAD superfamily hydrolase (TIGR01509 family)
MIRAIVTDFDGTIVDTFEANYAAYCMAFKHCGLELLKEQYHACFGLRFDAFMDVMKINDADLRNKIKQEKARVYPMCFGHLKPNETLINFIQKAKLSGVKTAIASTAQRGNLMNVLKHLQLEHLFDIIIAGDAVKEGKPNPEIYLTSMSMLGVEPSETLVFEDTEVGLQAAEKSGANVMKISKDYYESNNRLYGLNG